MLELDNSIVMLKQHGNALLAKVQDLLNQNEMALQHARKLNSAAYLHVRCVRCWTCFAAFYRTNMQL